MRLRRGRQWHRALVPYHYTDVLVKTSSCFAGFKFWFQRNLNDRNLVDPASSHMLVSKIKPCMSQYKLLNGKTANGSLKQLSFIWWSITTWITMVILELIHAPRPDYVEGLCLLGTEPTQALPGFLVIHDNRTNRIASLAINHSSFWPISFRR